MCNEADLDKIQQGEVMERLLDPADVAEILKLKDVRAVYVLIRQKRLKALRVGRRLRILLGDLNQYISEQRERGTQ